MARTYKAVYEAAYMGSYTNSYFLWQGVSGYFLFNCMYA